MSSSPVPRRLGVGSSSRLLVNWAAVGGEGVEINAEDVAVEVDGTLKFLAGVENPDTSDPSERSGWVPVDCIDVSARFIAADILKTLTFYS